MAGHSESFSRKSEVILMLIRPDKLGVSPPEEQRVGICREMGEKDKDQQGTRPALTVASSSRGLSCTWAASPFRASRCNKMEPMLSGESFSVEHCYIFQEAFLS